MCIKLILKCFSDNIEAEMFCICVCRDAGEDMAELSTEKKTEIMKQENTRYE